MALKKKIAKEKKAIGKESSLLKVGKEKNSKKGKEISNLLGRNVGKVDLKKDKKDAKDSANKNKTGGKDAKITLSDKDIKNIKSSSKRQSLLLLLAMMLIIGGVAMFAWQYGLEMKLEILRTFVADLSVFKWQAISLIAILGIALGVIAVSFLQPKKKIELTVEEKPKIALETKATNGAYTDIDLLYSTLQKAKFLKISTIAELFKIDKEKASEWCKILEEHGLAEMRYRVFAESELVIKEGA